MKPSDTLMTFIHPPDFGICLSQAGKRANRVKGNAKAMAKPNMPMAGATMLPEVDTSMRKMLSKPVVFSALLSTALLHDEGRVISKAPKKEMANTTSIRKKKMLNIALVERALRALAPKSKVTSKPKAT